MNSSRGTHTIPRGTGQLGKAGAAVSIAAAGANLLAYLVPLVGARTLDAENLGAIATMMAILAISSVPGMGLQIAVAVSVARHGTVDRLDRLILVTVAATVVPMLALIPVLCAALRLPWPALVLATAINALVIVASGRLGVLQGEMRFLRLSAGLVLLALIRCGGIIVGLVIGLPLTATLLIGVSVGLAAVAAVLWLTTPSTASAGRRGERDLLRGVWTAGSATLVLLLLSNADLIAARHLLPAAEAADYAVLSVLTKGAIWAPQTIGILALPYIARGVRNTSWIAATAVAGVGVLLVSASVLFGWLALQLAGGPAYTRLSGFAAAFAAVGALYALVFVLTNAQVATGARTPSAPLWVAVAGFAAVVLTMAQPTIESIVTCAIVTAAASATALTGAMWLTMRSPRSTENA